MYSAPITRKNPTLFVIMIDQSGSMDERASLVPQTTTKAEYVAAVTNSLISELLNRCRREEGVRDYFHLVAMGYSDCGVIPLLSEHFELLAPSRLSIMNKPRRKHIEERRLANGQTTIGNFEQTLWIEPHAEGNTPMYAAMLKAQSIVSQWCSRPANRSCYPPVIINISDGEATDADDSQLLETAAGIKNLRTDDGNAIFMNIHITNQELCPQAIFPCSPEELPGDRNARLLYEMSSEMPEIYHEQILEVRGPAPEGAPFRGVSYNTPITELVAMMNIGSMSVNLMQ